MNQHLINLGLTDSATIDDIKSSFRRLAKEFHPDINKNGEEKFKSIKASYEWLLKNHKPKRDLKGYAPYYAILRDGQHTVSFSIYNDTNVLENGIQIYLIKGLQEYRVVIEKGTVLPKTILLTNIPGQITIHLKRFEECEGYPDRFSMT